MEGSKVHRHKIFSDSTSQRLHDKTDKGVCFPTGGHQLTKTKGTKKINYFLILRPPGSFQADLMFADNPRNKSKQLPILCIIDTNTRYAYTYLLKNKTDKEVL